MNATWPFLRTYRGKKLRRIAMPLGGIGTGTISLSGRGGLVDWEIMNHPAKGFVPFGSGRSARVCPAMLIRVADQKNGDVRSSLLEGPLFLDEYEGAHGVKTPNHGYPRFDSCVFRAAYPLAEVQFHSNDIPAQISLRAFNPLIPGDVDGSGLPIVVLRYHVVNPSSNSLKVSIGAVMPNFIGCEAENRDEITRHDQKFSDENVIGVLFSAEGSPSGERTDGTFALATDASGDVRLTPVGESRDWNNATLGVWDRFVTDGDVVVPKAGADTEPVATLVINKTIQPESAEAFAFYLTWRFPNRISWTPNDEPGDVVGNYYATQFIDAADAVRKIVPQLPELEGKTVRFVSDLTTSDLPKDVKEAALFNLSTLRSETCFRTPDGHFWGFEGCCDQRGCCHGNCTHVWNYELATPFLFGEWARSMRRIEFEHATHPETGFMPFRVNLPIRRAKEHETAAADGQMGCVMKLHREWTLSGDDDFLRSLWPFARKALEFCWIDGGWDADQDGVMEGCQHNTMDVEYYGPNPQMTFWYLGALRAAEEMARHLGENDFAEQCRSLHENGSRRVDETLFNGEYYEHRVPDALRLVAPGLRLKEREIDGFPPFQLGSGCLVDQLVGDVMARIHGLEPLASERNLRQTAQSIFKHNYRDRQNDYNPVRSFVVGDEKALLMASYPRGNRPDVPFPYFAEVMTGFEYVAAIGLIQTGDVERGLEVVHNIRNRYDGERRNPFDEAECGHHYARAMASWGVLLALTGFHYSAKSGVMRFAAEPGKHFWSAGDAWGRCVIGDDHAKLTCRHGRIRLRRFEAKGIGVATFAPERLLEAGQTIKFD